MTLAFRIRCAVLLVTALGLSAGCKQEHGTAIGEEGQAFTLRYTQDISIAVEGTSVMHFEVTRAGVHDDVRLEFFQFPDGLTIVEQDRRIPAGRVSAAFTLKASYMAKPGDGVGKVRATAGRLSAGPFGIRIHITAK